MSQLNVKNITSIMNDYDVFLFDLWGVIVEGEELYPGVVDTVNMVIEQKKVFFVTNAPRPTMVSYDRIKGWGVNVLPEMVITSGQIARELINDSARGLGIEKPIVYHLGKDRNSDIMRDLKCEETNDIANANIMMLTLTRDEGEDLTEFDDILARAAAQKIITLCANPDTIIPKGSSKVYCPGFFAEKMLQHGGRVIYTGKPKIEMYNKVLKAVPDILPSRILMIGDTYETDILGAKGAGIHSALVLTGNALKFHVNYEDMPTKLTKLTEAAVKAGAVPNFVITLN